MSETIAGHLHLKIGVQAMIGSICKVLVEFLLLRQSGTHDEVLLGFHSRATQRNTGRRCMSMLYKINARSSGSATSCCEGIDTPYLPQMGPCVMQDTRIEDCEARRIQKDSKGPTRLHSCQLEGGCGDRKVRCVAVAAVAIVDFCICCPAPSQQLPNDLVA